MGAYKGLNGVNNSPDYKYYVVSSRGIESAWEYKEDAQDFKKEFDLMPSKIVSCKTLKAAGKDPDNDENWVTSHGSYSGLLSNISIGTVGIGLGLLLAGWYIYQRVESSGVIDASGVIPG